MAEKVSTLQLKVDLNCPRCERKIKKTLDKFPEISAKKYDEKQGTVTISGNFCPEKLKKKLCCKAGDIIKCIKIIPVPAPKPPEPVPTPKKPDPAPEPPKPKDPEPPKKSDPPVEKAELQPPKKSDPPPEPPAKKSDPPPEPPAKKSDPPPEPQIPPPLLIKVCCGTCHEGREGGPCYEGYGRPPPCYCGCGRTQCYCGCERTPCYCGCGGHRGNSYCSYIIEEEPASCVIM